ncbi:hypothetical protein SMACR_07312 [Sordaria macrospora]|uniref:WGS project CABT00000000 data, contig 2.44 n=2 Tax=Sordaria macrospora TaxID=5147 RepID=F7W8F8_SORMK|nr:uncharacterized protein SMAC_07312 [Sordaria macrospora k-hell]KAA8628677.1 hypothetical protein SMACR_07312 [Sordaria macrospora]KAH7625369.1 hypothetical protein B0T09DRAFT_393374 [Sordaria sp. MPI-SDFR-AT-0083]WPJ62648.1 hypothetical protein SMAC4_07312 [Sordaria macrospora]CCC13803.1 unnamed protein product [Sordaria macrospora k-hell]
MTNPATSNFWLPPTPGREWEGMRRPNPAPPLRVPPSSSSFVPPTLIFRAYPSRPRQQPALHVYRPRAPRPRASTLLLRLQLLELRLRLRDHLLLRLESLRLFLRIQAFEAFLQGLGFYYEVRLLLFYAQLRLPGRRRINRFLSSKWVLALVPLTTAVLGAVLGADAPLAPPSGAGITFSSLCFALSMPLQMILLLMTGFQIHASHRENY